jgi:hypothetical protein
MSNHLRANKGEWSEIYALFKLIADGILKKGDSNLKPAPGEEYKVLRLFKEDKDGESVYQLADRQVIITREEKSLVNTRAAFEAKSKELLEEIRKKREKSELKNGSFILPEIETFMNGMLTYAVKAGSNNKTDLSVEILDHRTSQEQKRGFSIKSQLGASSTLFNASGKNSCFRYRFECESKEEVLKVNRIDSSSKIQDKVRELERLSAEEKLHIHREGPVQECLLHNLTIIDDGLPEIVSSLLWNGYNSRKTRISDACVIVSEENPRNYQFEDLEVIYSRKIKQLLVASALGMTAAHTWDGKYESTGGYIVLLKSGDLISYHFYDTAEFEDYLFENTKLESPSSKEKKHSFAKVKEDSDGLYFDLCLQIRFTH